MDKIHQIFNKMALIVLFAVCIVGCGNGGGGAANPPPTNTGVTLDAAGGGISNGQTNVSTEPIIILQFASSMESSSINNANIQVSESSSGSNPVPLTAFTANQQNTRFSFSPASDLKVNTKYYILVKNTVVASTQQIVNGMFYFTTGSQSLPMVSIINPDSNATGVWNTSNIIIKFSKSVTGVNPKNIQLFATMVNGTAVPLQAITQEGLGPNTYEITLMTPMNYLSIYYLTLSSGITDSLGNPLNNTSFKFTTVRQPVLFYSYYKAESILRCPLDIYGVPNQCNLTSIPINNFKLSGFIVNESAEYLYAANVNYSDGGATGPFIVACKLDANFNILSCDPLNSYPHFDIPQNIFLIDQYLYTNQLNVASNAQDLGICSFTNNNNLFCDSGGAEDSPGEAGSSISNVTQLPGIPVVYVSAPGIDPNGNILKCTMNQQNGTLTNCSVALTNTGNIQFSGNAGAIYADNNGNVYIADTGNSFVMPAVPVATYFCSIDAQFNFSNCLQLNPEVINGLSLWSTPIYFSKYTNTLAYFGNSNLNYGQFTMISYLDNRLEFSLLSPGDGTFAQLVPLPVNPAYAKVVY